MYINILNNDIDKPERDELFFMSWRKTKSALATIDD